MVEVVLCVAKFLQILGVVSRLLALLSQNETALKVAYQNEPELLLILII